MNIDDLKDTVYRELEGVRQKMEAERLERNAVLANRLQQALKRVLGWRVTCDGPQYFLSEFPSVYLFVRKRRVLLWTHWALMARDAQYGPLSECQITAPDDLIRFIVGKEYLKEARK